MKLLTVLSLSFMSFFSLADISQAPPSLSYKDGQAVFVDIKTAKYDIVYDVAAGKATVESTIKFVLPKAGYPIFSFFTKDFQVKLDGAVVPGERFSGPAHNAVYLIVGNKAAAGEHTVVVDNVMAYGPKFAGDKVHHGFFFDDANGLYMEQYLPTSFEYDQHDISLSISITGTSQGHSLKTNGVVSKSGANSFNVTYPSYYNCSSIYFDLFPSSEERSVKATYTSINGKAIPVEVYSTDPSHTSSLLETFKDDAIHALADLEKMFGPYAHKGLLIRPLLGTTFGMEYAGATMSAGGATLRHEILHSFYSRGVMPADGNAGWIDEGVAYWDEHGSKMSPNYDYFKNLGCGSPYLKGNFNDGELFLQWLAYLMDKKGVSMHKVLQQIYLKYQLKTMTSQMFEKELSSISGIDFSSHFKKYIYANSSRKCD